MDTNSSKQSQSNQNINWKKRFCWTTAALSAVIVLMGIGITCHVVSTNNYYESEMATAKLTVFDELAKTYAGSLDILDGQTTLNQATGYGVSDEDGAFYITFDFAALDDENRPTGDLRHGIVYFWPDREHGGYSYAYSYPDSTDDHPGGVYYKLGL